ncbi:MAG: molybdenum cofactor biosynthesis protein MoaE [Archaeoglobaceae archaeon]
MKVFIPANWESLKGELENFGKVVEVRKGESGEECCIVGRTVSITTDLNLRETLEILCDLGYDFAALRGFDAEVEGIEKGLGFRIPRVSSVEDIFEAPEVESLKSLLRKLKSDRFADECGAIAIFVGFVRRFSDGREVKMMEYEAYEEALKEAKRRIEERIAKQHGVKVKLYHKRGVLVPGEDIVYVAVMGRHRRDVWEPLVEAVEAMKRELPIWKKEVFDGEAVWVHDKMQKDETEN